MHSISFFTAGQLFLLGSRETRRLRILQNVLVCPSPTPRGQPEKLNFYVTYTISLEQSSIFEVPFTSFCYASLTRRARVVQKRGGRARLLKIWVSVDFHPASQIPLSATLPSPEKQPARWPTRYPLRVLLMLEKQAWASVCCRA
jgi:hypothetical protein